MIIYLVRSKLLLGPIQLLKMVYKFIKWMLCPLRRQKFPIDFLYTITNQQNKIFLKINGFQNNIINILLFEITYKFKLMFTTSSNFIKLWPSKSTCPVWALLLVTWAYNLNSKSVKGWLNDSFVLLFYYHILFNSNRYSLGFINISKFLSYYSIW